MERNRNHIEAVGNLFRILTGNEEIGFEDENESIPDPQFEQKKAVTTRLIAHLIEAAFLLKSADVAQRIRSASRAANIGVAISGSFAIENATSGTTAGLLSSALFGYVALSLADKKAEIVKSSKGVSLTERDMQAALDKVNGNSPEDWINLVTIEDSGGY